MARSRSEAIADAIAARIVRNKTRKGFSTLYADALQEISMSTPTSSNGLNVNRPEPDYTPIQTSAKNEADKGIDLVEATRPRPSHDQTITAGMTTGSQVNVGPIRPVDRKTITGSTPGDFRKSGDYAKESVEAIKNAGGPREQMAQQKSSKFDSDAKPFSSSTAGSEGDRS